MMPSYSPVNLCRTVENRPRFETLKCTVRTPKAFPPYFVTGPADPEYWHWDHRWSDHAGGLKGGTCEKCGKKLKECRIRINPKTGEPVRKFSRIAREIALVPADVPPVRIVGFPEVSP